MGRGFAYSYVLTLRKIKLLLLLLFTYIEKCRYCDLQPYDLLPESMLLKRNLESFEGRISNVSLILARSSLYSERESPKSLTDSESSSEPLHQHERSRHKKKLKRERILKSIKKLIKNYSSFTL